MSIIMHNRATRLGFLIWCSCILFANAASVDGDGQALTNGGQIRMLFVAAIPWHYPVEPAATIVVVMTLIAAVTLVWVALLRRKVREQTRGLRELLERETALKRQYREIFDGTRDIAERKRAEEESRRAVSLLQSTLESTADGILVVDHASRVVSF